MLDRSCQSMFGIFSRSLRSEFPTYNMKNFKVAVISIELVISNGILGFSAPAVAHKTNLGVLVPPGHHFHHRLRHRSADRIGEPDRRSKHRSALEQECRSQRGWISRVPFDYQ